MSTSGSTTLSYTQGSSTIASSFKFNAGGGTGLSFLGYGNYLNSYYTTNGASSSQYLFSIVRTGLQQADLVDGNPYFSLTTSMKDLAGINTPSRINSLTITYNWDTTNDEVWIDTGLNAVYAGAHFMDFGFGSKIYWRWFGDAEPTSNFGRCQLILPTSTSPKTSPAYPISYTGNFTPVQRFDSSGGLGITFRNESSKDLSYGFGFDGSYVDLLTPDTFTLVQPLCLRIPQFQHVYDFWPFNTGKAMLYLRWQLKSIKFDYTYDPITQYKGIFYSDQPALTPGTTFLYKDPDLTTLVSPNGYVSDGSTFEYLASGKVYYTLQCQDAVAVTAPTGGTAGTVSSNYPSSQSGFTNYSFDQDVSYITLDASPSYPVVFVEWQATDFGGTTTSIGTNSSINIYNGLYASVTPIFSDSGGPPASLQCKAYTVINAGYVNYVDCYGNSQNTYFNSSDIICASQDPGSNTIAKGFGSDCGAV